MGLPVLAAAVLMAPRIANAEFGLFDDANSISVARQTWAGTWDWRQDPGQFGRFRPVYWLAFSAMYRWAGDRPEGYFIGNLLLLSITAVLMAAALLRLTRRPLAAGVAGMAFVLGGPAIEATYTLSKPELLQCCLLAGAGATIVLVPRSGARLPGIVRIAAASLLVLLAALTKETTAVLLVVAPLYLAMAWWWNRRERGSATNVALARDFLLACALGIAVYAALALASVPAIAAAAGPRANFGLTWAVMAGRVNIWIDWIVRDWFYLAVMLAVAAVGALVTRRVVGAPLMAGAVVWMGVWFGLYLPYRFTPEYYLLPFSLGASSLAGLLVLQVTESSSAGNRAGSSLIRAGVAVAAGLWLLTLPNNRSNAAIQLAVDEANSDMLRLVAQAAPEGARVLVNIRTDSEYIWHIGPLLHMLHGRTDLEVQPFPSDYAGSPNGGRPTVVVSPLMENIPYPSVRLGVPEAESRQWEAALQQAFGARLSALGESRSYARLLIVDAPRLICLVLRDIEYCQRRNTPFDTRRFAAGWKVYALDDR